MKELIILIAYIIACYGLSEMVVFSYGPFGVFEKWRKFTKRVSYGLGKLFSCMLCFPTWVGLGMSLLNLLAFPEFAITPFMMILGDTITANAGMGVVIVFMDMIFTAGACWLLYIVEDALERSGNVEYIDDNENITVDIDE
jgi:hypothetical protein